MNFFSILGKCGDIVITIGVTNPKSGDISQVGRLGIA